MRTKKALYNFITDFIPLVVIALIGFIKIKMINESLGLALGGLNTLFANVMTYLSIMDGGLTGAILYRLYKPIANQDDKQTSEILSAGKYLFNRIGLAMLAIGTLVSFFVFFFFKQEPPTISYFYVQTAFMIYLVSSVIPYFVVVNRTLFEADQKKYVTNIVIQGFMIVKSIGEIVLLVLGLGLIELYLLMTVINIGSSVIIYYLSKKKYPHIDFNAPEKDFSMKSDVKNLLIHKIGTMVAYNIDAIIIGSVIGIDKVPFYTAYQYITDNLMTMIGKITYSITAGIGDLIASQKERAYVVFQEINAMSFYIASVVCIPLVLVINGFINLWQPNIETSVALAICFVIQLFYYIIRMPLTTYCNASGLFRQTRVCPIIESVVNIVLSLILVHQWGIPGILIATFIAYLVSDYFIRPIIIYREVFNRSVWSYYLKNMAYIFLMLALGLMMSLGLQYLNFDSYLGWFISSCGLFIVNFGIVTFIYVVTKQADFMQRFTAILKRIGGK